MQKKICHMVFILVLIVISFNHYRFAENDKRNNIDIHEDVYVNYSVDYYYQLHGADEIGIDILPYNKLIGRMFYIFGKNYFVLRMSYLFFLLFFLLCLYAVICLLFDSAVLGLVVILVHLSIPGVISYSRMCWPQLYSASFLLLSVHFLWRLVEKSNRRILYFVLFGASVFLSVLLHYSAIAYMILYLGAFVFFQRKTIKRFFLSVINEKNYFFICMFVVFLLVFLFKSYMYLGTLFLPIADLLQNYLWENFIFVIVNTNLFLSYSQFYFYYVGSLFVFIFMFVKSKNIKVIKLSGFFLCYILSLIAFFVWYPIDATVFGLTSAVIIVSYCFVFCTPLLVRVIFYSYVGLMFFLLTFMPQVLLDEYARKYCRETMGVISDERDWGMAELKNWADAFGDKEVSVFALSFGDRLYPENSISHITYLDLKMLSSAEKMNLLPVTDRIDYLIFDDMHPVALYFFDRQEYFELYQYVRNFLRESLNFVEVKRIKTPLKDIVIYKTFGVTKDLPV